MVWSGTLVTRTFYAFRGVEPTFWVLFPGRKNQVLGYFVRLLGLGSLDFCYVFINLVSPHSPHVGHAIFGTAKMLPVM